ncbi:MAG: terminase, partial [Lentisphaerae bacterium]|nr:terminase [Lentisphaerota bacterium]
MNTEISLHKKQALAFLSDATEILYGGAAGGGKSYLLRVKAITCAMQYPGIQ